MATFDELNFKHLFDSLPASYIVMAVDDPDFTIVAQNRAHHAALAIKPTAVIGKPLLSVFPDSSEAYLKTGTSELIESFRKVIRTKKPNSMPVLRYDLKTKAGKLSEMYWNVTHYPLLDSSGNVSHIFGTAKDITHEHQAEDKLDVAERQLAQALSVGSIGTWLWDLQADNVIIDKNLAAMFNISEKQGADGLTFEAVLSRIDEADRLRVQKAIRKAIKTKEHFEEEYRTASQNGSWRWLLARGKIEVNGRGKPMSFPGVVVDITERKLAENNLRLLSIAGKELTSSLDYTHTLVSIANVMVPDLADWCTIEMLDDAGVLQSVAVAHKDPKKVAWAKQLRQKQGPQDLSQPQGVPNVLRTGKSEYYADIPDSMIAASANSAAELKLLRDLGLSSVIIVPITLDGATLGAITLISAEQKRHYTLSDLQMAEDLANRASLAIKHAQLYAVAQRELEHRSILEDQLRAANEQLERRVEERTADLEVANAGLQRSNRELQDFAYVASHDLQEPLRKIQAFGDLLETEYVDQLGDGADYLHRMRKAAARMSALIEDILSFSRITTKARGFTTVDVSEVVQEVLEDLETRIAETSAHITVGKLPIIEADAMQLRQLIQNLLGNALKFHAEGVTPIISVQAETILKQPKRDKYCILRIADNGVGFEQKYTDRIFSVFQRLHSRNSFEGTGIGLAVCRKIVERHGGTITATSTVGKGSTFIVSLPFHHQQE